MIAVTGAAGFVGSNLAHRLASAGHDLLLVDHPLIPGKTSNLDGLSRFQFIEHDPFLALLECNAPSLAGVFHLGACSRTTETDWAYLARNNVAYSQAVWAWCAANACPLVYASSAATYGDGSLGFDDRTPPERLRPLNLYGKSKNDFDAWVLAQVRDGRPSPPGWAGTKFFNVYGPREAHKGGMASVVWQAYKQISETGEVRLFRSNDEAVADGEQRRDFVFVEDCIGHMLWLWRHPEASGIYNSGTGTARTFADLVRAVFAASNPAVAVGRQGDVGVLPQGFEPQHVGAGLGLGFLDLSAGDLDAPLEGGDDLLVRSDGGFQPDVVVVRPADAGQGGELLADEGQRVDIDSPARHGDVEFPLPAGDDLLIDPQHDIPLPGDPRTNRVLVVDEPGVRVEAGLDQ